MEVNGILSINTEDMRLIDLFTVSLIDSTRFGTLHVVKF